PLLRRAPGAHRDLRSFPTRRSSDLDRDPQPGPHPRRRHRHPAHRRRHRHSPAGGPAMTLARRLLLIVALLCVAPASALAQQCVAGFPDIYGDLFADAQRVLPDPKSMVDAIPAAAPAAIAAEYAQQRTRPGFDLASFIDERFALPQPAGGSYRTDPRHAAAEHIDRLWSELERQPRAADARSSLLPLPQPYIVPRGRYDELYYWDSYFPMLGLVESRRLDLVLPTAADV